MDSNETWLMGFSRREDEPLILWLGQKLRSLDSISWARVSVILCRGSFHCDSQTYLKNCISWEKKLTYVKGVDAVPLHVCAISVCRRNIAYLYCVHCSEDWNINSHNAIFVFMLNTLWNKWAPTIIMSVLNVPFHVYRRNISI